MLRCGADVALGGSARPLDELGDREGGVRPRDRERLRVAMMNRFQSSPLAIKPKNAKTKHNVFDAKNEHSMSMQQNTASTYYPTGHTPV